MKALFALYAFLLFSFASLAQDDVFILNSSQSMVLTGKGIGQDGAINPYLGRDCIAVVENLSKNEFSIRIQQNGEIKNEVAVKAGETKEIALGKDEELYVDTEKKAKARVNFKLAESAEASSETTNMKETGEENLTTLIQRYVNYNHWANEQFAQWMEAASEEDLNREIESSFSSLQETVKHIWSAEYLWLQVVKDESYEDNPAKSFEGNKEELFAGWLRASENFANYVNTISLDELQAKRARSSGEGFTAIVDMIHHCMNHSTYHRGQLITMGRQAGLPKPPRTDFIYYVGLEK
jgi:uncharacterized damage-inducible protein DinB